MTVVLVAAVLAACAGEEPTDAVQVTGGSVRGVFADGVASWRAIPYAAPPVDELRWEPPQPPPSWDGERNGSTYAPNCPQGDPLEANTAEDCLYLNVSRPASGGDDLPVMVWIHGGGFIAGAADDPVYNSPALAKRGVVLVTGGYRLGRLGFFAHPGLDSEVGNFGLLDQLAELEWVQDNIEAFGGDPDNVTVFGQSAGAMSVNALMSSPRAEGLFDRAISQSPAGRQQPVTLAAARDIGAARFPGLDEAALRDLDVEEVLDPPVNLYEGEAPLIDPVLPRNAVDTFAAGAEMDVPLLVGTTDLEFNDALYELSGRSASALREAVIADRASEFKAAYGTGEEAGLHILSDALFTESARLLALDHADDAATYRYRFEIAAPEVIEQGLGAFHGAELPFMFDAADEFGPLVGGLADQMTDYWVDFARTGDPNGGDRPTWAPAAGGSLMTFTNEGPTPQARDPWDSRLDLIREQLERDAE